jgi:hypothetical protein
MRNGLDDENLPTRFELNVFINCPFDEEYKSLLRPLLFTVVYLGCNPRLASERLNSAENRVDKICELIYESKYGIHDLSRLKSDEVDEIYRLNMPFELGVDYGTREHGSEEMETKKCLILEENPYEYKKALSDLSGVDIKNHNNEADEIVRSVRDWFYETAGFDEADYPKVIWNQFNDFTADLFEDRLTEDIPEEDVVEDIERMPVSEYIDSVKEWVSENVD